MEELNLPIPGIEIGPQFYFHYDVPAITSFNYIRLFHQIFTLVMIALLNTQFWFSYSYSIQGRRS